MKFTRMTKLFSLFFIIMNVLVIFEFIPTQNLQEKSFLKFLLNIFNNEEKSVGKFFIFFFILQTVYYLEIHTFSRNTADFLYYLFWQLIIFYLIFLLDIHSISINSLLLSLFYLQYKTYGWELIQITLGILFMS